MSLLLLLVCCAVLHQYTLAVNVLPTFLNQSLLQTITKTVVNTATKEQTLTMTSRFKRDSGRLHFKNNLNLKWVSWPGSLPKWAVGVYFPTLKRKYYICAPLNGCHWSTGYYRPSKGPYCFNPCNEREDRDTQFDILVNEDNLEILQWKKFNQRHDDGVTSRHDVYVGKNWKGIGAIFGRKLYLPFSGRENIYTSNYDILTLSLDKYEEKIVNVQYNDADVAMTSSPTQAVLHRYTVTNNNCHPIDKEALFEESTERQSSWETRNSLSVKVTASIQVSTPVFSESVGVEVGGEASYANGNSVTETISHSLKVAVRVPPNHSCTLKMEGRKYKLNIPYTALLMRTYTTGTIRTAKLSGIYRGVQVGDIQAVAEHCQPIPNPLPCER